MNMDEDIEPSELLLETVVISEEEKHKIIAEIDNGFLCRPENLSALNKVSAKSNGLILPVVISVITVLATIISIIFVNSFLWRNEELSSIQLSRETSGTEWEMLKTYMEESSKTLEDKNFEIDKYKVEIINLDLKLSTLRQLLIIKKDTEKRLALERSKLITEGVDEKDINSKINVLEESIISELDPEMITFYKYSIEELNNQIDQVLDQKIESEENLEVSIVEREVLISKNEKIQDSVEEKELENLQLPKVIETINKLNKNAEQYEYEKIVQNEISSLYLEIFQDLEKSNYTASLDKIDKLEILLEDNELSEKYETMDQLAIQIETVNTLKEYVDKSLFAAELALSEKLIDKQETIDVNSNQVLFNERQEEVAYQLNVEGKKDSGELMLLGVISLIQFDRVIIDSVSGLDVYPGIEFYIFKRDSHDIKLGSGLISEVTGNFISGILNISSNSSYQPEADDLVYIKPDIN